MPHTLGDVILSLLKKRGLRAFELAEQIGVSPTSVSKIMNGVSRPRQNTFTKLCQVLCETKDEERALVAAFAGTEQLIEDNEPANNPSAEKELLRLRAEQFLERKTQAILFKRSVARELKKAEINYQQDYCDGPYSTDFLVEHDGKRIALECKSNLGRDLEKTEAICELLSEQLNATVHIVVPYLDDTSAGVARLSVIQLNGTTALRDILAQDGRRCEKGGKE